MYLYSVFHINSVFLHCFPYFTHWKNKNNLREFEPQNSKKFKNIQAELKNVVSYKKEKCIALMTHRVARPGSFFLLLWPMSIEESFLMFLEHNFENFDIALQELINHRPKFLKGSVGDACKMFMTLGGIFGCHITIN